jgi:hypothetical protein
MRKLSVAWVLISAAFVVACASDPVTPSAGDVTQINLTTESRHFDACDDALLAPVRFTRNGDEIVFLLTTTGQPIGVVWPIGFTAWLASDKAQILDPAGVTIAREGDVLDNLGGSGNPFHACNVNGQVYT